MNKPRVYGVTVGIFGTGTDAEPDTSGFGKNAASYQFVGYVQKSF